MEHVPPPPAKGYIVQDTLWAAGNATSSSVVYACKSGYKLEGDNSTTCILDGYWTQPNVTCKRKYQGVQACLDDNLENRNF